MRALVLAVLAGCAGVASPDDGLGALLQVEGGQFRPGGFPGATGGPGTLSAQTSHPTVLIGEQREQLRGVLEPSARAAIVGLAGADGSWIVAAGPPDVETPGQPSLHARFGLAASAQPGAVTMVVAAVDAEGRIGVPASVELIATPVDPPAGDLVVQLTWMGTADLDLHVIDPKGGEAWSGHPNTWQQPAPGEPVDPNAYLAGGILDHDANKDCHRDSTPSESVVWATRTGSSGPVMPDLPAGDYTVRVDAHSLCSDASAPWSVAVYRSGAAVANAAGIATPDDADNAHGAGAGTTALHVTLP